MRSPGIVELVRSPLPPLVAGPPTTGSGAEIVFHGRVRDQEEGRSITALDYEAYEPMAQTELQRLADETIERFGLHELACLHRVGLVPVGEPSLRVVIRSGHRGEALDALAFFVSALKQRVPIWKWGVTQSGERFPSHTRDSGATDPAP